MLLLALCYSVCAWIRPPCVGDSSVWLCDPRALLIFWWHVSSAQPCSRGPAPLPSSPLPDTVPADRNTDTAGIHSTEILAQLALEGKTSEDKWSLGMSCDSTDYEECKCKNGLVQLKSGVDLKRRVGWGWLVFTDGLDWKYLGITHILDTTHPNISVVF